MSNKHEDICQCTHSRAVHGPLDGHGSCFADSLRQKNPCMCAQFTWARFKSIWSSETEEELIGETR